MKAQQLPDLEELSLPGRGPILYFSKELVANAFISLLTQTMHI
jgi:hypothetical protein